MIVEGCSVHPLLLPKANQFLGEYFDCPLREHVFSVGVYNDELQAAAIAGVPTVSAWNDGYTVEIARMATDPKARDLTVVLHQACLNTMRAMGYRRILTAIRDKTIGEILDFKKWQCLGAHDGAAIFAAYQTWPEPD